MSSYVFDQIKPLVATGSFNFAVGDNVFYIALVNETVFDDFANGAMSSEINWSDIESSDISQDANLNNAGYEIKPLVGVTLVDVDSLGFTQTHVMADDVLYPISTIDAFGAVIFRNNAGSIGGGGQPVYDGQLITALEFGGRVSSNNGVYTIKLSDGFLRIK